MSAKRPVVDDDRFPLDVRAQLDRIEGFVTDTLPAELAATLAPHMVVFVNLVSQTGTEVGEQVHIEVVQRPEGIDLRFETAAGRLVARRRLLYG